MIKLFIQSGYTRNDNTSAHTDTLQCYCRAQKFLFLVIFHVVLAMAFLFDTHTKKVLQALHYI